MMRKKKEIRPLSPEEQIYAKHLVETYDKVIRRVVSAYIDYNLKYEAEDVVQNVYEMICAQLDDFKTYNSQEALIVTITTRAVIRLNKRWKTTEPLENEPPGREPDQGLEDILPASIPARDRRLLVAVYEHGHTEKEVAEDMGLKPAAVRQQVKRARDRLRRKLKKS